MGSGTLLAYISAGGATEQYADVIAETLRSRGREVKLVDLKREKIPDLSQYDAVILGTGVRMAMIYRRGKQFLRRKDLKGKRLAVYLSSGMAIQDPQKAKARFLAPLIEKCGLTPVMYDAFPGKMPGAGSKLDDRTDADVAREWAEELDKHLTGPA